MSETPRESENWAANMLSDMRTIERQERERVLMMATWDKEQAEVTARRELTSSALRHFESTLSEYYRCLNALRAFEQKHGPARES